MIKCKCCSIETINFIVTHSNTSKLKFFHHERLSIFDLLFFQIDKEMFDKVIGFINAGKTEGARCIAGGGRQGKVGFFVQPTVFADVKDDMKIAREEVRKNFRSSNLENIKKEELWTLLI